MKTKNLLLIIFLLATFSLIAQQEKETKNIEKSITLKTKSGNIEGTLLIPDNLSNIPVALIIAGSGPTDRDGNNPMMKNNSLKMQNWK